MPWLQRGHAPVGSGTCQRYVWPEVSAAHLHAVLSSAPSPLAGIRS